MKIRFYANLRKIPENATLEISDPSIRTLYELFDRLVELYPEFSPHLFDEHGDFRSDVPLFVNGRNPRLTDIGFDVPLETEDVISLFSPISSGKMNVEVMRSPKIDE